MFLAFFRHCSLFCFAEKYAPVYISSFENYDCLFRIIEAILITNIFLVCYLTMHCYFAACRRIAAFFSEAMLPHIAIYIYELNAILVMI